MAYYLVTAEPKADRVADLLKKLEQRAYLDLQPFGRSLNCALQNTRLRDDGGAVWEEEDYCSPPLAQERAAVLDDFFDDLCVTAVNPGEGWLMIEHLPRMFPDLPSDLPASE